MSHKNLLAGACLLTLTACGHYSPPETFEAKMARYQIHHSNSTVVPHIEPINFKVASSRSPASIIQSDEEEVSFSNKKLYFIALYRQYTQLSGYSSASPREINQCPSFHSALLDHATVMPAKPKASWHYETNKLNDDSYARYYPELYLPVSNDATPRVLDLARKNTTETAQLVQKAIDRHVDKTYAELAELCEYGSSDNYYAFENLHTEMKRRPVVAADTDGMKVLLKTTLFSNKALIESLKRTSTKASRAPASIALIDFDSEVMKRLGVSWAHSYYQSLVQGP